MDEQFVITGEKCTRIPEGVEFLNGHTIDVWTARDIEELYLPSSIKTIEVGALSLCGSKLTKLTIHNNFYLAPVVNKDGDVIREFNEPTSQDLPSITSKIKALFRESRYISASLKELVIYGEERELDLSSISIEGCFPFNKKPVIRIENEVTHLTLGDCPKDYKPLVYINNFIEDVTIDAPAGWTPDCFIFRVPQPNQNELDDSAIELTLAPRCNFHNDTRWSCPIKINTTAVTCIHPVEITCFENDKYQATKILLLGNRLEEIPIDKFSSECYPHIIVWEDMEIVYNKLKSKGWSLDK